MAHLLFVGAAETDRPDAGGRFGIDEDIAIIDLHAGFAVETAEVRQQQAMLGNIDSIFRG